MLRVTALVLFLVAALATAMDFRLYGLNYNSRQGPDWDPSKCKTQDQIASDMVKIKKIADRVRIYSLVDCSQGKMVLAAAKKAELKVWLGMWITDQKTFDAEMTELKSLVSAGSVDANVIGIHVGSENLYRKDMSPEQVSNMFNNSPNAISFMKSVKTYLASQSINIPVSIADIIDTLVQYPTVLDAVDIIQANEFPFWEPAKVDTAMINFKKKYDTLVAVAKGKTIQIGETGWASGGINANASEASPSNHAQYLLNFYNYANFHNLTYFYFAAFDDAWKAKQPGMANDVEAYFGLYDSTGTLKPGIVSLTQTNSSIDPDNTNITVVPLTKTPISLTPGSTNTPGAGSTNKAASSASTVTASIALVATIVVNTSSFFISMLRALVLTVFATVHALNVPLYGLNYNSRQGPDWDPNRCKTQEQIDTDMSLIKEISPRVRIYSLTDCDQGSMVLSAAKKVG
ncbi:glucan 1,3-beta-glucosidase, partial [Thraustotheca clavata]